MAPRLLTLYYDGLPNQTPSWKLRLTESAGDLFNRSCQRTANSDAGQIAALEAKMGKSRWMALRVTTDGERGALTGVSAVDPAHIRGLGSAVHLSAAGCPLS